MCKKGPSQMFLNSEIRIDTGYHEDNNQLNIY